MEFNMKISISLLSIKMDRSTISIYIKYGDLIFNGYVFSRREEKYSDEQLASRNYNSIIEEKYRGKTQMDLTQIQYYNEYTNTI